MGEGERRAYHDLMSEYADAKREAREARALVRELVEALEVIVTDIDNARAGAHGFLATVDPDKLHNHVAAALTRAREAGYGKEAG